MRELMRSGRPTRRASPDVRHSDAELMSMLEPQKFSDRSDAAGRIFLFGGVSKVIEDDELAAGDLAMEAFSIGGGNEAIPSAPDDQRRLSERGDALSHEPRLPLPRAIDQRAPV